MSDPIPLAGRPPRSDSAPGGGPPGERAATLPVAFTRLELSAILNVYGRQVADGHWRDYALDCLKDEAVFSIFRRASEMPIYRIVKRPKLARRQGAYAVIGAAGQILKRGQDLAQVLKVFERRRLRVVE